LYKELAGYYGENSAVLKAELKRENKTLSEKTRKDHCNFINGIFIPFMKTRKTENAKRYVPLHPFVYEKIQEYIAENNIREGEHIFNVGKTKQKTYKKINIFFGNLLGYSETYLNEKT
jgi:hypothetical protein